MREHPIPQDITNYKFHLVGSMTLKQFAEIMAGAILALLAYKSGLPSFIKWPLAITFGLIGFGAAFVPIEERPLDQWIINFVKVLYKPTKFFWRREPSIPDAFNYEVKDDRKEEELEIDLGPARKEKIQEFLQSMNNPIEQLDDFDRQQQLQVSRVLQVFNQVSAQPALQASNKPTQTQTDKPNLKVRVRKMKDLRESQPQEQSLNQKTTADNQEKKQLQTVFDQNKQELLDRQSEQSQPNQQVANPQPTQAANQNQSLPFPNQPQQPNKIVGMVLSKNNDLIDNALIEIKNQQNQTITAVKSNGLGQFFISQPLANGTYIVKPNKQNYDFGSFILELAGEIVKPLEIRAHN